MSTVATVVEARPLIRVGSLHKLYYTYRGEAIYALRDVSLDITEGEFVTVVGPSGCGKSTLLKILGGLVPRTQGQAVLRSTPIRGPRRDVGIVFQDAVLLPWRTVLENVMVPVEVQRLDRGVHQGRALALLELVGLRGFEHKYPTELSGGMQQRVAICRALVHDPSLLLMDEPFGALDAMTREQMNIEMLRIWHESRKTVFFITHSIPEAVFLADRVVVMSPRPGRIVEVIPVALARPRVLDVMTTEPFGAVVRRIRGLITSQGALD